MHSRLNMASPNGVSLGFLFLILTLSYGSGSGSARKLSSDDDIMLTENNELERQLGEESMPHKDASPGGESTSFSGNQVACGHPSCGAQIAGPNCQNSCPSCGCSQSYPQPQPAYPQPAYPQPQPAYPQPQPAYPQPAYPQPQPAYPPQVTPGCQPNYPPQPEPNYPPQPEPTYPPWPEPTYPPWTEPAYPPQPEPAYPPQSKRAYPPPTTGPRPTSQSPGNPTNEPNSLQQENIGNYPMCTHHSCTSRGGLITQRRMTIEEQSSDGLRIETPDTSDSGSVNEQLVSDIPESTGSYDDSELFYQAP